MLLEEFILPRSAVSCLVFTFHPKSAQSLVILAQIFRPFTLHGHLTLIINHSTFYCVFQN